jgi:protein TonB
MSKFLLFVLFLTVSTTYSQTIKAEDTPQPPKNQPEVFVMVEQMPEFPGGQSALVDYLSKNIHYPTQAKEKQIQGKVIVRFTVNSIGKIENAIIARGVGSGCDEEALRVVNAMPQWKPGRQNGKAVNVAFTLPINFSLQ